MPKSSIKTYTISTQPPPPPSSVPSVPRIEIPSHGNDIKIIITEPTPTEFETPTRVHVVETTPISQATQTVPTTDLVEIPLTQRTNSSTDDWIETEKSYSMNSER